jgi:hypothetical protein
MAKYEVKTLVEYTFEVEADSKDEAEQKGWEYEEHRETAEVSEITVLDTIEDEDEDEDTETEDEDEEIYIDDSSADAEALASAGFGTDEDYL